MDITKNGEVFSSFDGDVFNNFLEEEIPQDIFDDIMNDVNFNNAINFDMTSLSSEDSGRSSSSYEDQMDMKMSGQSSVDGFFDQPMAESSPMVTTIKQEPVFVQPIKTEPKTIAPTPQIQSRPVPGPIPVTQVQTQAIQSSQIFIQQPYQNIQTQSQPQLILQQQNILVKHEPIKIQQSPQGQQQILTLQNIGGNLFTTVSSAATTAPPPVHTIVNGATGILTKIPIVPVTRILPSGTSSSKSSSKDSKKSGHNIIERRYRTSIVI